MKSHHQKILQHIQSTYETIGEEFAQTRAQQSKDLEVLLPYIQEYLDSARAKADKRSQSANTDKQDDKDKTAPTTLLDLGCGNGRLTGFLAINLNPKIGHKKTRKNTKYINSPDNQANLNYIGIDSSKTLLKIAQKQYPQHKFMQGDLLNIPLKDKSVDIICCIRSFHHLPSHELQIKALQEMHRVLKSDGLLIITVWNLWQSQFRKQRLKSLGRSIITLGKWNPQGLLIPWGKKATRFYYAFKPDQLKKLAELSGYTSIELAGISQNKKVEALKGSDIMMIVNTGKTKHK